MYFSYYFFINENQNLKFEIVPKIDLNEYLNKKFTASYFELFTKFEEYSQKNNIFIHSINKEKNGIKEILKKELENIDEFCSLILESIEEFNDKDFINLIEKQIIENKKLKKVNEEWLENTLAKLMETE